MRTGRAGDDVACRAALDAVAAGGQEGDAREVVVDPAAAVAAFGSESHLRVDGLAAPMWDPLSGTYPTRDRRRVRLHTNYRHDRAAALRGLGLDEDATSDEVAALAAATKAEDVERRVLVEGAAAAASRAAIRWEAHPHREVLSGLPLVAHTAMGHRRRHPQPARRDR